jgi:hypothetical protein
MQFSRPKHHISISDIVFPGFFLIPTSPSTIMRAIRLFAALPVSWVVAFSFTAFDLGFYGIYPRQRFYSVNVEAPAPKITR